MLSRRERLILLNLVRGVGSTHLRRLWDAFGDLERIFRATPQELQQVEGIGPTLAQRIASGCRDDRRLEQELKRTTACGVALITREDADYPTSLRMIHDPPLVLYVKGALTAADELAVAIVGTRRASFYGIQSAERLGYDLALRGVTIVSGLARGIDGAAHRGALKAGGRTIAVLGSGLARLYPAEHTELAEHIAQHGAVISEYPMEMEPFPGNFPRRNRIISGLSLGVVVVEAPQRSGALITADCALEQGKDVFAVPGPMSAVTSQGTHGLLKQGARLVTSVEDILDELRLTVNPHTNCPFVPVSAQMDASADNSSNPQSAGEMAIGVGVKPTPAKRSATDAGGDTMPLPEEARRIVAFVSQGRPRDIDEIAAQSGLPISEVSSWLLRLELKQLIQQLPGKQFVRVGEIR